MEMGVGRREFLKGGLAAAGFLSLSGGRCFAAPAGWKPKGKPDLVVGILSDTHLQTGWDGVTPHKHFPHTYVANAMRYFRDRKIDAFMHLGDMAHRGKIAEAQYHRDIFDRFLSHGKVEKLLVVGNHEWYGEATGFVGASAVNIWKDPVERAKHTLCSDMPRRWEQVWGERYEPVWHKEVKGYHFFGRHWDVDEMELANLINAKADECSLRGTKPFFILSHKRNHFQCNAALRDFPNAIAFCGHWHMSNADWKTIFFDEFGGFFPTIQVGACRMDGGNALDGRERITKGDLVDERDEPDENTDWPECKNPSRQGLVMSVYGNETVVIERREFGGGGSLGPDWVFPIGEFGTSPYSRAALTEKVGSPEFGAKAKLVLKDGGRNVRLTIPMADGNPESRVYAYDIVVSGDDPKRRLFRSVYFEGCNAGIGHEPNGGETRVELSKSLFPNGKTLTLAVRPISSLGTKGKAIGITYRA